jgi:hypothetical protein
VELKLGEMRGYLASVMAIKGTRRGVRQQKRIMDHV